MKRRWSALLRCLAACSFEAARTPLHGSLALLESLDTTRTLGAPALYSASIETSRTEGASLSGLQLPCVGGSLCDVVYRAGHHHG
jgi:hypothetical protein